MPTTIAPLIQSQLVAVMRAVTGYQAPDASTSEIPVFDSTEVELVEVSGTSYLVIGWPGYPSGDYQAAEGTQRPVAHAASNRPTEEEGLVRCKAVGQTGDTGIGAPATARDLAYVIVQAVDQQLRNTASGPLLGVDPVDGNGQVLWARVDSHQRYETAGENGCVCEVDFGVRYRARI